MLISTNSDTLEIAEHSLLSSAAVDFKSTDLADIPFS